VKHVDLDKLEPKPARFGECQGCAYLAGGSAAICFACASRDMEPLPSERCKVCDQRFILGKCPNIVCSFTDRHFDRVSAISMRSGPLEAAINRYKYEERRAWATIFGRILVGYLDDNPGYWWTFDFIVASPTYVGQGGRSWDHVGLVLEKADVEAGGRWPFDVASPRAITQVSPTERFVDKGWKERRAIAEGPLREALLVPDPDRVRGKRIVVFDDVFTEGLRMREVARALVLAGASAVEEIVLARQPAPAEWGP